jgi:RNA polymerase sigma factor (sigma-70 family)
MHEDHQYIEALRRNDQRAIREIYQRYASHAIRWVTQHNGSIDDARDVFQEAVVALFEKAQKSDFVLTCPIGALLHLIYSRKWIDRLRQKNKESAVRIAEERRYNAEVTDDALSIAESAIAADERQRRLAQTFTQISELCQQLIRLLSEGLTPKAAAEQLQMNSVDTLYRRKNACMERWRELLRNESSY